MFDTKKVPLGQLSYAGRYVSDSAAVNSTARTRAVGSFQPTKNQRDVADAAVSAILAREPAAIVGNAGTGKTVTLAELVIPALLALDESVVVTAFTHRACSVLREKLDRAGHRGVEVQTLASLLGFREWTGPNTVEPKFEKVGDSKLDGISAVIVDEASMVGSDYARELARECLEVEPRGLLFVGDDAQLGPVGHPDHKPAPAFQLPESSIHRLQQVHRNAGPILDFANAVRVAPDRSLPALKTARAETGEVIVYPGKKEFSQAVADALRSEANAGRTDSIRVLAYTNEAIRQWNQFCRERAVGKEAPAFYRGERLISRNAIFDFCDHFEWEAHPKRGASTELTVLSEPELVKHDCSQAVALKVIFGTAKPELWSMLVRCEATGEVLELVAHDPSENHEVEDAIRLCWARARAAKQRDQRVDGFSSKAWAFAARTVTKMLGHQVQPRYALTVHKSQGGEWPEVFVDLPNFDSLKTKSPRQFRQLAYTATTRAAETLHLRGR